MPDTRTLNAVLGAYGMSNLLGPDGGFNWWNIIGGTIFGIIGWFAFAHGRKEKSWRPLGIGIVLMLYTFFIANTWLVYMIGIALTAALYFWRE